MCVWATTLPRYATGFSTSSFESGDINVKAEGNLEKPTARASLAHASLALHEHCCVSRRNIYARYGFSMLPIAMLMPYFARTLWHSDVICRNSLGSALKSHPEYENDPRKTLLPLLLNQLLAPISHASHHRFL